MSVGSWKKEFYTQPTKKMTLQEAVDHSVKKWSGTTPSALRRHEVVFEYGIIRPEGWGGYLNFWFDTNSCALCKLFYKPTQEPSEFFGVCGKCPLNERGEDAFGCGEGTVFSMAMDGDPAPMRAALRRIRRNLLRRKQKGAMRAKAR